MGEFFIHDGHLIEAGPGEWGKVDAIDAYERGKQAQLREMVRQEVERAQKPREGHWIVAGVEEGPCGIPYIQKQCSVCGFFHSLKIPDNFCPKCGSHNEGRYEPNIKEFLEAYENSRG